MARLRWLLAVVTLAIGISAHAAEKPNIVFILADDLGVNDLGCYGRKDHRTPHLDKLARDGVRFTAAYAAQSVCSPTRAALMTGKAPARLHLTTFLRAEPTVRRKSSSTPRSTSTCPWRKRPSPSI